MWRIRALGLLVVSACSQPPVVARQSQAPAPLQLEFDRPDGLSGPTNGVLDNAVVRFDLKTRAIRTVEGLVRVPNTRTSEEAAKAFIESAFHLSFSGDAPTRLMLDRNTDTLVGHRFIYQLYYARIDTRVPLPIAGSLLIVNVNKDNLISYASNDTVSVSNPIVIRASSAITRAEAEKAALAQHGDGGAITSAAQVIAVSKGTPVLLWKVNLLKRSPAGAFEVLVDGATGRVVSNRNTSVFKN